MSSLIAFKILIPVCLIAGIISFHLLTIRDGQPWGDDFSMYLQHARNLAECKQYGDPQFIFNPNTPVYAPRQYPIGYPLTILPLYALFGVDFYPYKVFNIFLLGIALGLVYYWPHWVDKPQELLDFCRNQGVSYVIPSGNLLIDLVHKLPDHFEMVFNNEQNSVYKIRY